MLNYIEHHEHVARMALCVKTGSCLARQSPRAPATYEVPTPYEDGIKRWPVGKTRTRDLGAHGEVNEDCDRGLAAPVARKDELVQVHVAVDKSLRKRRQATHRQLEGLGCTSQQIA
jgi:hypothetical protein